MPDKESCSYILVYIYKMYAMIFIKISSEKVNRRTKHRTSEHKSEQEKNLVK